MARPFEQPSAGSNDASSETGEAIRASVERQLGGAATERLSRVPPLVPDHTLLQQIGAGAYGEVWLARNALGTARAVKIVYRENFEEERPYQREFNGILKFEPVSRSHEGLVAVLHVGRNEQAGYFYYVMELADEVDAAGPDGIQSISQTNSNDYKPHTLRSEVARRQRLPPAEAARLVLRLAGALAHLHKQGLVHRDIKPSNVIFVGGQPKLADIGLVTGAGDSRSFVGTEGFIPPEGPGTPQADIFSLGKLLYELATGRDRMDFPQLPGEAVKSETGEALLELNEVITRACAPATGERYATAGELEADLNFFLAGRSLREARQAERHVAWLKRLSMAAGVIVLLAVAAAGLAKKEERQAREREEASKATARVESRLRQRAEAAEREQSRLREEAQTARVNEAQLRRQAEEQGLAARMKAYASDMNLLRQALAADDLGRAQELLERQRPEPGQQDVRGWEWRYYWQFCQSDEAFTLCQRSNSITSVSFSRDGALLAVGTWANEVTVWDVGSRQMLYLKPGPADRSAKVAFAPNGPLLAFNDQTQGQHSILVWDSNLRTQAWKLPLNAPLRDLAFARDGRLFTAELSRSNNIKVWDLTNGTLLSQSTAQIAGYAMGTVFTISREGSRFAYALGGAAHSVRLTQPGVGEDAILRVTEELTTALTFSSDGALLVTGGGYAEGAIKLWDVATRQPAGSLDGHRSWVSCLRLLPDGRTLASCSADRTIRLWELQNRLCVRTLRGHGGELWTVDASPDGQWLASGCKDGSVSFWNLHSTTNRPPTVRTLPTPGAEWWSYSPDGRWFGALHKGRLSFYDSKTLEPATPLTASLTNIFTFAFSPDMRLLVTSSRQGQLTAWELPSGRALTNFAPHPVPASGCDVLILADGKTLLTSGADRIVKAWELPTWKQTGHWQVMSNQSAIAICQSLPLTATASREGQFELVSAGAPERRRQFRGQTRVCSLDLSEDGKLLAAASENGTVELWNTDTLTRQALWHGVLLGYHSVAISRDGQRVAAGSNGQEAIKMWDAHSHEEVATLAGQGSFFADAQFSPDGATLGSRNWNGVIHFWRAPSWEEIDTAEKGALPPLRDRE